MKKLITFILATMTIFSVVGCGNDEAVEENIPVEDSVKVETSKTEEEIIVSDKEVVIVDNEMYTFKVKGMVQDNFWETQDVKVYVENKTDKTLHFSWDEVSVNGYMVDPFWGTEVAPGKKENTTVSFYDTSLAENDIDLIKEITFVLNVYDDTFYDSYCGDTYSITF
jgi:nitrogen regulatory protein PII